jgi:glutathione S-transferase
MYTVIGHPRSRAMRVLWMLEELELPYEHVPATPRSEAAMAANPTGKIPILLIDGRAFTDSVAIVQYLADAHGRFTAEAGTEARLRQDGMTQFAVDEVEGALWQTGKHSFVLPEERRVPAAKETARWEFGQAMAELGRRLGDRAFVAGDDFTVPDLLLGHCASWAEAAKMDMPGGAVGAYFERMRARPALARAMQKAVRAS